jgi:hypothetical protein
MVIRSFPTAAEFKPSRTHWQLRLVFFLVAIGVAVLLASQLLVTPWWKQAGFATDPGNFVRKNRVGYAVCAPWSGKSAGHVVEASTSAPPGRTVDVGVLLPPGAEVLSITCGVSLNGARPAPCLPDRCIIPLSLTLDDDTYKGGRGLVLTARNNSPNAPADVSFRIAWR